MKKNGRVFFGVFYSIGFMFLASLQAVGPLQSNANGLNNGSQTIQKPVVSPLGKNRAAWAGSWASLGLSTIMGSFLTYKASEHLFEAALSYIPFLRSYHEETAKIAALTTTLPFSLAALVRGGPLALYFFYIVYSGERVSPLLARDALHDVRVYVQHLQTIKDVQKELYEVIAQINALSEEQNQKKNGTSDIDFALLAQLEEAIKQDDEYVLAILTQLQSFLSQEEIDQYMQGVWNNRYRGEAYCVAPELQGHTQAIIAQLQTTVNSLGDDALLLNNLMKGLVDYWQLYTVSLAEGINAALHFCNEVHGIEQIVSKWFNRSLLCA